MRQTIALCVLLAAAGCAGTGSPEEPDEQETTAGGEATGGGEEAPEPVMRATTPIPVPQPAVPREELGAGLQGVWERVEEAVSVRPPDAPEGSTQVEIEGWLEGAFTQWFSRRNEAMVAANGAAGAMGDAPAFERAVAAGLLGYMFEDMVSGMRGAPVPDPILNDPELVSVYVENLNEALMPFAVRSAQAYLFCATTLNQGEGDNPWQPWVNYCDERGAEVVQVYQLTSTEPVAPSEDPGAGAP